MHVEGLVPMVCRPGPREASHESSREGPAGQPSYAEVDRVFVLRPKGLVRRIPARRRDGEIEASLHHAVNASGAGSYLFKSFVEMYLDFC